MGKKLIVAFDGLDYELIQNYGLENVKQAEFGRVDNHSGVKTIVTTELFASFITGQNWEVHGVIGLGKYRNRVLNKIEKLNKYRVFQKFTGLRGRIYEQIPFLDGKKTSVTKEDLESATFFDYVSNSKAIDVPSYSVGYDVDLVGLLEQHGIRAAEKDLNRFTEWKKRDMMEALEGDYDLIMAHFHKPDHIQHWFWEIGKMDKVEETYHEMDELAAEIKEKAGEEGFDTVLFMSDHGLPDVENGGHNENAFYSCNRELFGDKTPHITDFYEKIVQMSRDGELEGVEV